MKKIKLLLGNFTFEGDKVLIHEIEKEILCDSVKEAYRLGNENANMYGAFLITSEFKGEIINDFQ